MPDIRYHFIYLIAVFLMLGVGMLMGAGFVGGDQIKRQTTYIRDLKAQTNRAVQQGSVSQDQADKLEGVVDGLRPTLVRSALAGRRVTLVQTGDYANATQDAVTALSSAGASPVVIVALSSRWAALSDDARATALSGLASALSSGTASGANAQALQGQEDQGLVAVTGDLDAPCSLFVLVGGAKDPDDGGDGSDAGSLDTALILQMRAVSGGTATIVGCEPFSVGASFIPAYQSAQVSTVDCIDQPLGQLDLPFALRGGPDADDYGLKATAKRQIPATLTPGQAGS